MLAPATSPESIAQYFKQEAEKARAGQLTRADEGLPDDAFVFCCLNGMQKITQEVFALWLRILQDSPNSVLWLLTGGPEVDDRLRDLAQAQGVAPHRVLFAQKRPNALHLARMSLADLFLDTFPYPRFVAAHLSFWKQDGDMDIDRILAGYHALADRELYAPLPRTDISDENEAPISLTA